jgi:glycosyltransferase involved in cell wall biosynthesis
MLRESGKIHPSTAMSSPMGIKAAGDVPLVTLGLPVYNGENYLRQALESLLSQTFKDWELILSDNGSTDGTEAICREFAARDIRVRYLREPVNRGATWNFNRVFRLSRSPLFRWAAHDDVCAPELLERCVAALRARPDAVLAFPRTRIIGPRNEHLGDYPIRLRTDWPDPAVRFHDCICVDHACFSIFGLIRADRLRRTPLLGSFAGADRNLLAELSLLGSFAEVPEILFHRRDHPGTSTRQYPSAKDRAAWFRTDAHAPLSPTLRRAWGYWQSLNRAPLGPRDRLACLGVLGKWAGARTRHWVNRRFALSAGPVPVPRSSVSGSASAASAPAVSAPSAHPYIAAQ